MTGRLSDHIQFMQIPTVRVRHKQTCTVGCDAVVGGCRPDLGASSEEEEGPRCVKFEPIRKNSAQLCSPTGKMLLIANRREAGLGRAPE